jgi:hypothetical protein
VFKKCGVSNICFIFREYSQKTKKDAYVLPRIEEILDCLAGNRYFSVIDMKSGFHQIEILEEHKERTAFTVGPLGLELSFFFTKTKLDEYGLRFMYNACS